MALELFVNTIGDSYKDVQYALNTAKVILSSNEFFVLYSMIAIVAAFIGIAAAAFSSIYTHKIRHDWTISVFLMGVIFYYSCIRTTANVLVYNDDQNSAEVGQFQPVNNVPVGVALPAWLYAYSEKMLTNIIRDYAAPLYPTFNKGIFDGSDMGFKTLMALELLPNAVNQSAPDFAKYVKDYTVHCALPAYSNGLIEKEDLLDPSNSLWTAFSIGANGGYMMMPKGNGEATCNDVYSIIKDYPLWEKIQKKFCQPLNISPATCGFKFERITDTMFNADKDSVAKSYFAAFVLNRVVSAEQSKSNALFGNTADLYMLQADKQATMQNALSAFTAEKWLPKLRSSTFVVVILLAPIAFLLIFFAPGQVIKWYGGMYVWLILWAGIDQLLLMKYQNDIYNTFATLRSNGIGLLSAFDITPAVFDHLGMYGKMRWIGMSLALAMSMGILRIGNHAMANIAGSMGQAYQSAGEQAGAKLGQVGGTDAARDQYIREQARGWAAGMTDVQSIANQEVFNYQKGVEDVGQRLALGMTARSEAWAGAVGSAANINTLEKNIKDAGGDRAYIEKLGNMGNYDYNQRTAAYDTFTGFFGGDSHAAALALGEMSANQQYINLNEMNSLLGAAGGIEALGGQKGALAAFNHMQSIGGMAAFKKEANTAGVSIAEWAQFKGNGNVITEENRGWLSKATGIDEGNLHVGATLSFNLGKKGKFDNFEMHEKDYTYNGVTGTMTTWYGEDGNMFRAVHEGVGGGAGTYNYGQNWQLQAGGKTVGTTTTFGENETIAFITGGGNFNVFGLSRDEALSFAGMAGDKMSGFIQGNLTSNDSLNAGGSARGEVSAETSFFKIVKAKASVEAHVGMETSVTESQNVNQIKTAYMEKVKALYDDPTKSVAEKNAEFKALNDIYYSSAKEAFGDDCWGRVMGSAKGKLS